MITRHSGSDKTLPQSTATHIRSEPPSTRAQPPSTLAIASPDLDEGRPPLDRLLHCLRHRAPPLGVHAGVGDGVQAQQRGGGGQQGRTGGGRGPRRGEGQVVERLLHAGAYEAAGNGGGEEQRGEVLLGGLQSRQRGRRQATSAADGMDIGTAEKQGGQPWRNSTHSV